MRKITISMLVLLVALAVFAVSPAFSFEAAGDSSITSVAKGCCPSQKASSEKADNTCDECKNCDCKDCCKDGKCSCTDDDCKCPCKDSGCKKSKGSCKKK